MKNSSIKYTPALLALLVATSANAEITGSNAVAAADFQQYNQVGTSLVPDNTVSLSSVLAGNAAAPGGNVELFKSSEQVGVDFNQTTSLVGTLGSETITLSSLNASDWSADVGGQTLLQKWVADLFTSQPLLPNSAANQAAIIAQFEANGGKERFSDPNISYVNSQSGTINIGLAGFLNAKSLLQGVITDPLLLAGLNALPSVQISELVKVSYNGSTSYLYGFSATASGLASNDGSFNGNYNLTLADTVNQSNQFLPINVTTAQVPEPSAIFLLGLGLVGLTVLKKKKA